MSHQPHPNAQYLRALADGKRVSVSCAGNDDRTPLQDCSTTVQMSFLRPGIAPQECRWEFHIEQEDAP